MLSIFFSQFSIRNFSFFSLKKKESQKIIWYYFYLILTLVINPIQVFTPSFRMLFEHWCLLQHLIKQRGCHIFLLILHLLYKILIYQIQDRFYWQQVFSQLIWVHVNQFVLSIYLFQVICTDIIEGFGVIDSVGEYDTMCTFIIGLCNIFISLLSSSIPDLEFESMIVDSDGFDFEVDSNSGNIILFELIITESDQDISFSYSTITNDDKFKQMLLFLFLIWCTLFDRTHSFILFFYVYKMQRNIILMSDTILLQQIIFLFIQKSFYQLLSQLNQNTLYHIIFFTCQVYKTQSLYLNQAIQQQHCAYIFINIKLSMYKSSANQKAHQFHKQIARQKRRQIFAKKRQQLIKSCSQFPLRSQFLQKYWQIPQNKLYLHRDEIFDTLDDINGQQLTEEQSQQLCHDLLHLLMHDNQFLIPFTMKFRKDSSLLTATVVAFVYDCIDMQEGNYWLSYMNDDCKNAIYLNMQCGQDVTRYIGDPLLLEALVQDWGNLQQAQGAIGYLLGQIQIGQQQQFVQTVFDKLHQMNKKNSLIKPSQSFLFLLIRLMIHYQSNPKIFQYLKIVLNQSIHKLYNHNPNTQLDQNILFLVDIFLDRNKDQYRIIFSQINFQYLLKMILNYYVKKFIHNEEKQKYSKKKLSPQKLVKIHSNFINRFIDICMNHLRMHRLYKNHISIDPNLINAFKPQQIGQIQEKYQKLVEFNNIYLDKNTLNNNQENQKNFKRSYQEFQI